MILVCQLLTFYIRDPYRYHLTFHSRDPYHLWKSFRVLLHLTRKSYICFNRFLLFCK
eukprot:UN03747